MNQEKQEILDVVERKKKRKGFRWSLKKLFIVFLIILNMLAIALNSPLIQEEIASNVGDYIYKKTGYGVKLKEVALNINKGIQLKDFSIIDLDNQPMIQAGSFSTSLVDNLLSMFLFNEFDFSEVKLENANLNIVKNKGDERSNLQDFLYKLGNKKRGKSKCAVLDIDRIDMVNVSISNRLFDKPNDELITIEDASIVFDYIDLCKKFIRIKSLDLYRPSVEISRKKNLQLAGNTGKLNTNIINLGFLFKVGHLNIQDGKLKYEKGKKRHYLKKAFDYIDFANLEVDKLNMLVYDMGLDSLGELNFSIKKMSLIEKNGFTIDNMVIDSGTVNNTGINLKGLNLKTESSRIKGEVALKYKSKKDFNSFEDKVLLKGKFQESQLKFKDIIYFAPKISEESPLVHNKNRLVKFKGNVTGVFNDLKSKSFNINVEDRFNLSTAFRLKNLAVKGMEYLKFTDTKLSSTSKYIAEIADGVNFGSNFPRLGKIEFNGDFEGLLKDFQASGTLVSELGNSNFDLVMKIGDRKEDLRYSGDMSLNSFDLGRFLGNDKIGVLSVKGDIVDGRGFNSANANAKLKAKIDSFEYKGYKYKDVSINGLVKSRRFNGDLSIVDKNINFELDGLIDMEDSIPLYNFKAKINKLDLFALKLYKIPLELKGDVNMDFIGSNVEDFSGKMFLKKFILSNGKKQVVVDSLNVSSVIGDNRERYVDIDSDIFTFYFDGKYKLKSIPKAVYSIFDRNFSKFVVGIKKKNEELDSYKGYYYDFNLDIPDSKDVFEILTGKNISFNNLNLIGSADHRRDSLVLKLNIDTVKYDNNSVVEFTSDFNLYQGYGDFSLNSERAFYNNTNISRLEFDTDISKEELFFQFSVDSIGKSIKDIALSGRTIPFQDSFGIEIYGGHIQAIEDNLEFSGQNRITVGKNYINLTDFVISEDDSKIIFNDINDNKGVEVELEDFDIGMINVLLKYKKLHFTGKSNGFVKVNNIFKEKYVESDIQIPDLKINNKYYGSMDAKIALDTVNRNKLVFNFGLNDVSSHIKSKGFYKIKEKVFYGDFNVDKFPLEFLENIINDGISNTEGVLTANMRVFGPFKKVSITGNGVVYNGQTTVDYIGVPYYFDNQKFTINDKGIDMSGAVIRDEYGNKGIATGGITFDRFRDFGVDVKLTSDRILALDTNEKMNPDYWGRALGKVSAVFKGKFKNIIYMKIDAETGEGTSLTIPVKLYVDSADKSFINYRKEKKTKVKNKIVNRLKGIDVDMSMKITDAAKMKIIMDPNAGDNLVGRGTGLIRLLVSQDKDIEMYGDFKFETGKYLFTLYELVNKEFTIRPGSKINWYGDPFEGIMDIKADYLANHISLANFISEYIPNNNRNYKGDVALTSMLTGPLLHPNIDFDFSISNVDNSVSSIVVSKLQKLKSSPNAVYTQVVGLLVWGSFLPDENLVGNLGNSGFLASGGINTISEWLTTKLSGYVTGLLSETIAGSDLISGVDFSLNSTNSSFVVQNDNNLLPQYHNLNTTVWLLDDKIKVQFGTDYTGKSDFGKRNNFISGGNVDVELFLTENKNLRLRLFFKREFDEINTTWENKSGLGFRYSDDFGDIYPKDPKTKK